MNTIEELQRERNAALANYEAAEEAGKAADRACNKIEDKLIMLRMKQEWLI